MFHSVVDEFGSRIQNSDLEYKIQIWNLLSFI